MNFAERLKKIRIRTGLTRKTFSERLCVQNITPSAYQSYEDGRAIPPMEKVVLIQEELKKAAKEFQNMGGFYDSWLRMMYCDIDGLYNCAVEEKNSPSRARSVHLDP